jgi:hypothetical protein
MHLSHCQECREELAGLAGLPALLGRVPAADAERLALDGAELRDLEEPSPEMLSSLLDQVAAHRRSRRWRVLTAAAAVAVIAVGGGVAGGMAVSGHQQQHQHQQAQWPEQVQATSPKTHITVDVSYAPAVAGTTMNVRVGGVGAGTTCKFWVVDSSGQRWLAGSWTVSAGHEHAWYPASSSVLPASVSSFQLTSGTELLVNVPAS